MRDELFQTFDLDGRPLELVARSRVHREGLWHRAASVYLFLPDGRLVIQRRQATKDVCPWFRESVARLQLCVAARAAIRTE